MSCERDPLSHVTGIGKWDGDWQTSDSDWKDWDFSDSQEKRLEGVADGQTDPIHPSSRPV